MPRGGPGYRLKLTQRREKAAEMYLRGFRQSEIGEQLGIDQSTVSDDLRAVQKLWMERAAEHLDAHKAKELHRIDDLERTYWDAWERSKKPLKVKTQEMLSSGGLTDEQGNPVPEEKKARLSEEEQTGNVAYLQGVERCIAMRCKLLGLNAPEKTAQTDPTGTREARAIRYIEVVRNAANGGPASAPAPAG
jgi:predicted transcriptional regulator